MLSFLPIPKGISLLITQISLIVTQKSLFFISSTNS